ncbi:hypothetical protein BDN71DRAFT_1513628 [Pleurotus eryngii]|uniref:Uncharacterized protein n=1 Tax=Pleurotus eryngii TaxID=5323 RepID=A0A9P5ZGT5_PLEER|nr:hypothetical protein BDN71DRAFT_1513628 [Pleurotus eryngii]
MPSRKPRKAPPAPVVHPNGALETVFSVAKDPASVVDDNDVADLGKQGNSNSSCPGALPSSPPRRTTVEEVNDNNNPFITHGNHQSSCAVSPTPFRLPHVNFAEEHNEVISLLTSNEFPDTPAPNRLATQTATGSSRAPPMQTPAHSHGMP